VERCGIHDDRENGRSSRTKSRLAKHVARVNGQLLQHGYRQQSLALKSLWRALSASDGVGLFCSDYGSGRPHRDV